IDRSALVARIEDLLLSEPDQASLAGTLDDVERAVQRSACRVLDRVRPHPGIDTAVLRAAAHPDPIVRLWAAAWEKPMRAAHPEQAAALRNRLAGDPFAGVRLRAVLATIEADGDGDSAGAMAGTAAMPLLRRCLFDRSAMIRHVARFHLKAASEDADFVAIYRDALALALPTGSTLAGPDLLGAIGGLGETGRPEDRVHLLPFLDGGPKTARAALRAMAKLDPEGSSGILLDRLIDERRGVRNTALALLPRRLPAGDAATMATLWRRAATLVAATTVSKATLRLPPWPALGILLDAVAEAPAPQSNNVVLASAALQKWRPEQRRNYAPTLPTPEQRVALGRSLEAARDRLPPELAMRIAAALAM
ncbi:MAG TPA: hypothetical protein VGD08_21230, partial [Stellaceae bacterium]